MLGERVKRRREALGLTQVELGEKSGLNQAHISRIEKGRIGAVSTDTMAALVRGLTCSSDYLLGLRTDPSLGEEASATPELTRAPASEGPPPALATRR